MAAMTALKNRSPGWLHFTEKNPRAQPEKVEWEPPAEGAIIVP